LEPCTFDGFAPAAEALRAWERRYNLERFSMALNGLTPAEKLATFTRGGFTAPLHHGPPESILRPELYHGPTADRRS
jgi:hypothetical protein